MSRTDNEVNQAAIFTPMTSGTAAPAIEVAGVSVAVWRGNGVMRISVCLDDHSADTPLVGPEGRVPLDISVEGVTVYSVDDPGYPDVTPNGRGRRHSPGWAGNGYGDGGN